jgi:DNA/RNA endonuclease G (NUC1)
MKTFFLILITCLIVMVGYSQTNVITKNSLIIPHGDITLYLDDDTTTLVSKQIIKYENFKNIGKFDRCNCWFQDTYKGKYIKSRFSKTGFDMGHLTPSSITSYDSVVNKNSFSMFNEAPQYAYFNEHPWKNLEMSVEDTIAKYKKDAIIITGVIYDENNKKYLPKSKIKIPTHYYKIVIIGKIVYVWLGVNADGKKNCKIRQSNLFDLNKLFVNNKMQLIIK